MCWEEPDKGAGVLTYPQGRTLGNFWAGTPHNLKAYAGGNLDEQTHQETVGLGVREWKPAREIAKRITREKEMAKGTVTMITLHSRFLQSRSQGLGGLSPGSGTPEEGEEVRIQKHNQGRRKWWRFPIVSAFCNTHQCFAVSLFVASRTPSMHPFNLSWNTWVLCPIWAGAVLACWKPSSYVFSSPYPVLSLWSGLASKLPVPGLFWSALVLVWFPRTVVRMTFITIDLGNF